MESIIITVPPTVGVTIRLRMNSHLEMASCAAAATRTRVVSVAGPPSATAVMQERDGKGGREHRQHGPSADRPYPPDL